MQTTNGYWAIVPTTIPYLNIDNNNQGISLTTSANNTVLTYIQVSRTMKVRVNAFFQMYSAATLSGIQFAFWNITDAYSEIWNLWTASTTSQSHGQLVGVITLTAGKSYSLDFGTGTANQGLQVRSFGLDITEVVESSTDTFNFNSVSTTPLTVQNISSGNSAVVLKNNANSWRLRTDVSGALLFEKESAPGSGTWVQKGAINA